MSGLARNRYRNQVGLALLLHVVAWIVVLVAVWGMQVMVKQRMADARHRIRDMRGEMDAMADEVVSLRSQQAAMLNRDAMKRRLEAAGSSLVDIQLGNVRYIDAGGDSRMAARFPMEGRDDR